MKGYIYLAGPYSHELATVRHDRYVALSKKAAELMRDGHVVYSPITHGHVIARSNELPTEFNEFWRKQCFEMLRHSSQVMVLRLDGYHDSVGVNAEIGLAIQLGIPVDHIDV